MSAEEKTWLRDLAVRVVDGESIDWEAEAQRVSDASERNALERLKVLGELAASSEGSSTFGPAEGGRAGERLGSYVLRKRLGEGGMGEVWEAEQTEPIRRPLAVKVIKLGMDTRRFVARFEAERQALALMDHPSIARVYEAGSTDRGRPYFAMELVRGVPITEHCDRQRLTTRERVELFRRVCDGVQHAHQKAIIHRDLKPSNVLVAIQDGRAVPKIIDFGVAKALDRPLTERTVFTEAGQIIGTPAYMSPEQAEMTAQDVDTRTDVYALGALLYEMLSGAPPFDPKGLRRLPLDEMLRTLREDDPPKPSTRVGTSGERSDVSAKNRRTETGTLARQLRGDLDWITMRALEKDRTRRYGSPAELAADLGRYLANEPVSARPPSAVYRTQKFVRRNRVAVGAAAVGLLVLIAFAVAMTVQSVRVADQRDRAALEAASAERISAFLGELFAVADPGQAHGNTVTARELLDRGAGRIDEELAEEPELQGRLMHIMSGAYRGLGLFERAEPLAEQSLRLRQVHLGEDHPDTLTSAWLLASVHYNLGHYREAEKIHRDVLQKRSRVLGADHADTLRSMNGVGILCHRQGRYDEAETLFRTALDRSRRVFGDEHRSTLRATRNLAMPLAALGRLGEAEALLSAALEIGRRTMGDNDPATLNNAADLAYVALEQGRPGEAETLQRECLPTMEQVVGPEHWSTVLTRKDLAAAYVAQGRFEDADAIYRDLIETEERFDGADHPRTLSVRHSRAKGLERRGDAEQAAALYRQTFEGRKRAFGETHPVTVETAQDLAATLVATGRTDEARRLTSRLLDLLRQAATGGGADRTARYLYARVLLNCEPPDLRDPEEALRLATALVASTEAPDAVYLDTLALTQAANGQTNKAAETLRAAIDSLPASETWLRADLERRLEQLSASGGIEVPRLRIRER